MIPPFTDLGKLPPGVHPATLAQVAARLGTGSELRRAQVQSLQWMIDLARRAGVSRIILNGSFVTDTMEPNDVDCVLLVGPAFRKNSPEEQELRDGLPFLTIELVEQADFDFFVNRFFATDRDNVAKGMIEVIS